MTSIRLTFPIATEPQDLTALMRGESHLVV